MYKSRGKIERTSHTDHPDAGIIGVLKYLQHLLFGRNVLMKILCCLSFHFHISTNSSKNKSILHYINHNAIITPNKINNDSLVSLISSLY